MPSKGSRGKTGFLEFGPAPHFQAPKLGCKEGWAPGAAAPAQPPWGDDPWSQAWTFIQDRISQMLIACSFGGTQQSYQVSEMSKFGNPPKALLCTVKN